MMMELQNKQHDVSDLYFDKLEIVIALRGMMLIAFAHEGISSWGYTLPETGTLPSAGGFAECILSGTDRKSVVQGKSVQQRVDLGGRRII